MSRRRPSGAGSNSQRFAEYTEPDGTTIKVPVVKDAGTFVYIRGNDGEWPLAPVASMPYDAVWMEEGQTFDLEDMRAGNGMGSRRMVQAVEVRRRVSIYEGKWGQVKRLVLVAEVVSDDEFSSLKLSDLESEVAS